MLLLVFLSCVLAAGVLARPPPPAVEEPHAIEIEDTYIIKFRDDASDHVIKNHTSWIQSTTQYNEDGTVSRGIRHIFSLAFDGYSAVLDRETLRLVRHSPEVSYVNTVGTSIPPKTYLTPADGSQGPSNLDIQTNYRAVEDNRNPDALQTEPSKGWNANRISHREFDAQKGYVNGPYIHDGYQGQGVNVYVLDTGINLAQPGFKGSTVLHGKTFVRGTQPSDLNGHGTMCAGVIAGNYAGLAPRANTTNVKIANDQDRAACDDTVAGIEWVVSQPGNNNMKVISMSQTGFTGRPDVSAAVAAAVKKGVHAVVCAGNYDVDACSTEPGNAPGAIVVGSVDANNKFPTKKEQPEGTNIGKCVTLFAPGSRVPTLSAKNVSPEYHYWAWGTSIAAPQVAALVANQLSRVGPQTPDQIREWLVKTATKGQIVGDLRGSPNLIAYSGIGEKGEGEGVAATAAEQGAEDEKKKKSSGRTTGAAP
jgi:subtilisin family serine protease